MTWTLNTYIISQCVVSKTNKKYYFIFIKASLRVWLHRRLLKDKFAKFFSNISVIRNPLHLTVKLVQLYMMFYELYAVLKISAIHMWYGPCAIVRVRWIFIRDRTPSIWHLKVIHSCMYSLILCKNNWVVCSLCYLNLIYNLGQSIINSSGIFAMKL